MRMQKIKFLGAAGTVTGSSYVLTTDNNRAVMVDLGMFQGRREINDLNYRPLDINVDQIEAVILTHAHLDHCGRLPLLMKKGFRGKIYMTPATEALTKIVLADSAKIAEGNTEHEPLYTSLDVEKILSHMFSVEYDEEFIAGPFFVTFRNAGHILGSASAEIRDMNHETTIAFSGDLGNTPEDLVAPTEYIKSAHYVVMESTYGNRIHPNENPRETIQKEINTVEGSGGTLLIPSFSIERTQAILHIIDHLKKESKVGADTPVYLDSPMGLHATEVYKQFKNLYGAELYQHASTDDPFDFPGLHIVDNAKKSRKLKTQAGAKVIIAGSGMMSGGRILNHAIDFLPIETTRLLIVGFQAEDTIGREIMEGSNTVEIYGQTVAVKAHVTDLHSMSAHADKPRLMKWLENIEGAKKVFLTHGEDEARVPLSKDINEKLGITDVVLPNLEDEVEL